MAWPSSTKASTTNVDAGSDKPSLARADIKQNIDNVNAIIDTFDIASPNNGDILQYNSTSGAWEPVEASSTGTQISFIQGDLPSSLAIGDNDGSISLVYDNGLINVSGGNMTFASTGTYKIRVLYTGAVSAANVLLRFRNNATSTYTTILDINNPSFNWKWVTLNVTNTAHTYTITIDNNSGTTTAVSDSFGFSADIIKTS